MRGRVCWVAALIVVMLRCVSAPMPKPTAQRPIPMCHVTCPEGGFLFGPQLMCRGGKRWFEDFLATGEQVVRSIDGTVKLAVWLSKEGDFPKSEVITTRCAEAIRGIVQSRASGERGVNPGEPDPLHPQ